MEKRLIKILIIEDDLIIAENIRENLEEIGYDNIHVAKDYDSVKEIKSKLEPDIFLVDILLNQSIIDGIDIMLHEFPYNDKPLIYISSLTDNITRLRAKRTKPSAYLVKPFSAKQLEVAIDFALSSKLINSTKGDPITIDHYPFISEPDSFYIKVKNCYERIVKSEILFLQSQGSYTDIITSNKQIRHYFNIKTLLERINMSNLLRCHNSFAINLQYINSFDNDNVYLYIGDELKVIPISHTYKRQLMDKIIRL